MQLTAAVINAGIGDLSVGLQMAGFQIVAAYETDGKAIAVHKSNIDTAVYPLPLDEQGIEDFPQVDLLAAHIYQPTYSMAGRSKRNDPSCDMQNLLQVMECHRPRAFFLMLNAASAKNTQLRQSLSEISGGSYHVLWQIIDVAQITGFPVKERTLCVVGTLKNAEKPFQFPEQNQPPIIPTKNFLCINEVVDPWYYNIKPSDIPDHDDGQSFFCWKTNAYEGTDIVQWNFKKIPFVKDGHSFRRITHREIANLKGFPKDFSIPDTDRQRLYRRLMYTENVLVIKQIAGMISYTLSSNPWRDQLKERGSSFEDLFKRYLKKLIDKNPDSILITENLSLKSKQSIDFIYRQGENTLYFEVKHYNSSFSLISKVSAACKQISSLKADGIPILVVANEVPPECKEQCLKQTGVCIWDVENLLWLFDEFTDIKNEFIASLGYAIEHIIPKPPEPDTLKKSPAKKKKNLI